MDWVLGIDIGGSKVAMGLVGPDGRTEGVTSWETRAGDGPESLLGRLQEAAREYGSVSGGPVAAGVGVPGPVHPREGTLGTAVNLPGWEGLSPARRIGEVLGLLTVADNDANAAAWGEWCFGAGRGTRDFVCLTVGTGIGCGIVCNGTLVRGAAGFAGEAGHIQLLPDGPLCHCGRTGCWEALSSGTAIERMARETMAPGGEGSAREVFEAAARGDAQAVRIVGAAAGWMAVGIGNLALTLNPARIAIGGGVGLGGQGFFGDVSERVKQRCAAGKERPKIVRAALGPDAGVIGAAALALRPPGGAESRSAGG